MKRGKSSKPSSNLPEAVQTEIGPIPIRNGRIPHNKILRASKAPIFLVRPQVPDESTYDKWTSRTIITPLDGSELAESALSHVEAGSHRLHK